MSDLFKSEEGNAKANKQESQIIVIVRFLPCKDLIPRIEIPIKIIILS
jgi:hypothetical protein